ncbi:phosphopantetheine-binding protein [Streptomyces sp. NPDC058751]|uniref:phosphopantetheine-binding protein n=1 Tax=Streptomyces sp. NPDC058751 TaxID=3346623 RepID=UPI003673D934
MTSEPTASFDGPRDILAELTAVLADVVHADPDRVDPEQPFPVLGLDSLLTVEFVSAIDRRLGVRIAPADLYTHATPALLARHLAAAGGGGRQTPAPQDGGAAAAVLEALRHQLADILHCDPWEIDDGAAFAELGIDSILAAGFADGVNRAYGLSERPVTVHEHPGLAAMAAYIASRTQNTPTAPAAPLPAAPAAPVPAAPAPAALAPAPAANARRTPPPAPRPAGPTGAHRRPALSPEEVLALLDAVRGERIGVDEAAALLTDGPA